MCLGQNIIKGAPPHKNLSMYSLRYCFDGCDAITVEGVLSSRPGSSNSYPVLKRGRWPLSTTAIVAPAPRGMNVTKTTLSKIMDGALLSRRSSLLIASWCSMLARRG